MKFDTLKFYSQLLLILFLFKDNFVPYIFVIFMIIFAFITNNKLPEEYLWWALY